MSTSDMDFGSTVPLKTGRDTERLTQSLTSNRTINLSARKLCSYGVRVRSLLNSHGRGDSRMYFPLPFFCTPNTCFQFTWHFPPLRLLLPFKRLLANHVVTVTFYILRAQLSVDDGRLMCLYLLFCRMFAFMVLTVPLGSVPPFVSSSLSTYRSLRWDTASPQTISEMFFFDRPVTFELIVCRVSPPRSRFFLYSKEGAVLCKIKIWFILVYSLWGDTVKVAQEYMRSL